MKNRLREQGVKMINHEENLERLRKVIEACDEAPFHDCSRYDLSALYLVAFDAMKKLGIKRMELNLLCKDGEPVALNMNVKKLRK